MGLLNYPYTILHHFRPMYFTHTCTFIVQACSHWVVRPRYVHLRRSSIGTVTIPPHIQEMPKHTMRIHEIPPWKAFLWKLQSHQTVQKAGGFFINIPDMRGELPRRIQQTGLGSAESAWPWGLWVFFFHPFRSVHPFLFTGLDRTSQSWSNSVKS